MAGLDLRAIKRALWGQGDDDLIGGQGTNKLYAWSRDPMQTATGWNR